MMIGANQVESLKYEFEKFLDSRVWVILKTDACRFKSSFTIQASYLAPILTQQFIKRGFRSRQERGIGRFSIEDKSYVRQSHIILCLKVPNKRYNCYIAIQILSFCHRSKGERYLSKNTSIDRRAVLRRKVRRQLNSLGFKRSSDGRLLIEESGKDAFRNLHRVQRKERIQANRDFINKKAPTLIDNFASGKEVDPENISPKLKRVHPGTPEAELFRFASLTWSVPVSGGFGRRLRYIVRDEQNGKLIGLIALGDPVFNLSTRDKLIGWNADERAKRLVNIMEAYVLGALPPYNLLLGGKLVASLLRTRNLYNDFKNAYGQTRGIISKKKKKARLLAITTTSSMGRSSVYNRVKLDGIQYLQSIGYTNGWGHFHIPDRLFSELREYLRYIKHDCTDNYCYGDGPNWRLRATRSALAEIGIKTDDLRHTIQREVFICKLASNAETILRNGEGRPKLGSLLSAKEVAHLAVKRWMIPRSIHRPEYKDWNAYDLLDLFGAQGRRIQAKLNKSIKA